jgi:hypothetical protein
MKEFHFSSTFSIQCDCCVALGTWQSQKESSTVISQWDFILGREMKNKVRQMIRQIFLALTLTKVTGMHLRAVLVFPFPMESTFMTACLDDDVAVAEVPSDRDIVAAS